MFIKPSEEELKCFEPDFVVYNASKAKVENYKELGLNSETAVVFNISSRDVYKRQAEDEVRVGGS